MILLPEKPVPAVPLKQDPDAPPAYYSVVQVMRAQTSTPAASSAAPAPASASSSSNGGTTTFELPVSATALFIRSVNSNYLIRGEVNMSVSAEPGPAVYVKVSGTDDKCRAKLVQEPDGSTGVELYRESSWSFFRGGNRLTIDVRFPAPQPGAAILYLKEFTTSVGMFAHEGGYLAPKVKFGTVRLQGMSTINIESLNAERATLKTSNAQITGSFHADEDLKLTTSNSPIKGTFSSNGTLAVMTSNSAIEGEVRLFNSGDSSPSKATLATSNSKIKAEVVLTAPNNMGGAFKVDTTTSNSKIDVVCASAPIASELNLIASTSNSTISVGLHPTYQGKISASTSNGKVLTESDPPARDPTGLGRQRIVNLIQPEKKSLSGEVRWGAQDDWNVMGKVDLSTSNSNIVVSLK